MDDRIELAAIAGHYDSDEGPIDIVDRAYIMFEGKVQASGTVRDLVYDDRVAQLYLGPTLTARLRARLESVA